MRLSLAVKIILYFSSNLFDPQERVSFKELRELVLCTALSVFELLTYAQQMLIATNTLHVHYTTHTHTHTQQQKQLRVSQQLQAKSVVVEHKG